MVAFSLTPLLSLLLLLSNTNAAPTTLTPETTGLNPIAAAAAAGQPFEEEAHQAYDSIIKRHPCAVKASIAYNNYEDTHRKCEGRGLGSLFHGDCWFAAPTDCCPENRMSKTCKKFWPA